MLMPLSTVIQARNNPHAQDLRNYIGKFVDNLKNLDFENYYSDIPYVNKLISTTESDQK